MLRFAAILAIAFSLHAEDRWTEFRSGPFEVFTNASDKNGREVLQKLEQLRHVFGALTSKPDAVTTWPIRIVVAKGKQPPRLPTLTRDVYMAALPADAPIPREWLRAIAALLLEANCKRMPGYLENGLLDLLSAIEVNGAHVSAGVPENKTKDWARMHLFVSDPEYTGKVRVLLFNLQQIFIEDPAYRNAFGQPRAAIDQKVEAYWKAGQFASATLSARPLDPERDFRARPVDPARAHVVLADLTPGKMAYQALGDESAEGREGLGLLLLAEGNRDDAKRLFLAAIEAGSKSARALCEAGKLEEAAKANPRWSEPYIRMAQAESDPGRKAFRLKQAAAIEPRSVALWQALGEAQLEAMDYKEASKSWLAAEQAAPTPEERARIGQARRDFDEKSRAQEEAERKRIAEEKQKELDRLREAAEAEVRAAEDRVNRGQAKRDPNQKIEQWWDGPRAEGKLRGGLERVDCISGLARLQVRQADNKLASVLVRNPRQIVIMGGGQSTLGCGPQKPVRKVYVEYAPKTDAKYGTVGDAALIEFQ